MKPHRILPLVFVVLMAGLVVGIWEQRRKRHSLQNAAVAPVPAATDAPVPGPAAPPLTDDELRELLSLRRDVGQLRQRKAAWKRLEDQHQRLTVAVSASSRELPPEQRLAAGAYLPASQASFRGLATPTDAVESFVAAARAGDAGALLRVLAPDSRVAQMLAAPPQGDLLDGLAAIGGLQILSIQGPADGQVEITYTIDPRLGGFTDIFRLQQLNGEWRLDLE
ncbi:MAG: hypothetical protein KF791_14700 [Verrucomicrobiae bacterium]|nr:hypothetical protein [Verrucomicrobiae bacterium]